MPMSTSFISAEDRLDLSFHGDLDLTLSEDVCRVFASIPASLRTCIMDLTRLDRVFDSGIALLWMLNQRLYHIGATVVVLSDHPEVLRQIPRFMRNALSVVPKDSPRTLESQAMSGLNRV